MTSETADKDTPPVAASPADEVVGASDISSQNTDDSMKNSQGTETNDTKQESAAADKEQEDVEMKGMQADDKKQEDEQEKDVDMTDAKDESEADVADGEKTGAAETTAASTKETEPEDTAADEKTAESDDVEMKLDDDIQQEAQSSATESPKKTSEEEAADKNDAPSSEDNVPTESEHTDAETKDTNNSLSPTKRKGPVDESTSEISNRVNGAALPTEPAAKKHKVDATNPKTTEKLTADTTTPATDEIEGASPSVMISRDDMAKMEEDSGRLKFDVITNDGTDEHMIQLTTLKNIFAKQLPKMPKEYIVRLVFDKNHRSMLLLKNGTHVIGGICYRPFEKNQFAEIAFCAINASDQVKGYGTRLMNHLKEYVKTKNITHFLTYADNYAIGYFKKQGFTKSVSMARPNWYGYIKDYDGGTLMECTIHTQINYLRITSMVHKQRKAIQDKIEERSRAKTVYPGLTQFAEGRLMDIYMVPGVKEAGWSQAVIRNNRIGTRDQGSLKSQLAQLLKAVSNHRSAWPFHEPVDTTVVVDYLDHIKEPVDLQLISKRIDSGTYMSKAALKADLEKMCDNCTTYNTPDTNYYKAAVDLREFIQSRIQIRDHK